MPPERNSCACTCAGATHRPAHRGHSAPRHHRPGAALARLAISFEGANPRHEHEWKIWKEVKLPPGKILIPGVIDSTTSFVEHPELIAERIRRYAECVGRENLIAGTDCGFVAGDLQHGGPSDRRVGQVPGDGRGRAPGVTPALALSADQPPAIQRRRTVPRQTGSVTAGQALRPASRWGAYTRATLLAP